MPAKRTIPRVCDVCAAPFLAVAQKVEKGRGRFCGRACHDTHQRSMSLADKLWSLVDKNGPVVVQRAEYGNCWPRNGHRRAGYTRIYHPFPHAILAHRAAWEEATGEMLTSNDVIGHICDVRHCVRNNDIGIYTIRGIDLPRRGHLFKGTHANNHADMMDKGRHRPVSNPGLKGSAAPWAKLTEDNVRDIRQRYAGGGVTQTALGKEYGVHNVTISEIILRKKWQHID